MMAESTIHVHFVGGRGKCGAGLGVRDESNSNADVGISEKTCNADDAKQTWG
jgi:hypothetical protein